MDPVILYIHGFASSGHSAKAGVLKAHFGAVYAPSLSHIPALAVETLEEFLAALGRPPLLVGSSLGGYYALHLSAKHGLPAVLVNPVVMLNLPLGRFIGMNRHYFDGSQFEFTLEHLKQLEGLETRSADPGRLLLLLQLGDALLDHRQTLAALPGARAVVDPGGHHGFEDFPARMAAIRAFARDCNHLLTVS